VKTVAMQSTGVYWISLYEVLENAASRSISLTLGTPRICRDARVMCGRANGC
jgi:hypothetical protein